MGCWVALWVPYGVFMGLCGVPTGLYGSLRIHGGLLWVFTGPYGSLWFSVGSLGPADGRPPPLRYELGPALFVGWGGAALLLLGGSALLFSCRSGSETARYPRVKAANRKTGSGSATDYV